MYLFKPYQFKIHQPSSSQCPRARSGHRVVCNEKYLYSYGGYNPQIRIDDPEMSKDDIWLESKPLFKELWRFNLSTNEWKRMSGQKNYPIELASTAVILRGNKLIIFGGTAVPFGESCSNHLYVCNIDDGSIRKIEATGSLPNPQYGQALICHNNYLYTVGGTTGYGYECHIHRCNLSTGIWETVYICSGSDEMEPAGRYRHELAYDGKMIYVLGGGTVNQSFGFLEIPAFNLITNKWTSIHTHGDVNCNSEVPQPRRCHGAVQYTDDETGNIQVVISGGYTGLRRFDDMWRLDLVRRQWTRLKSHSLPCRVYFHSVGLTPFGKMYTFGGIIGDNSDPPKRTRKVHSIWLKIPKLTEICWEALNYYHKDLKERTRDQLLDYGIPIKFIQRLEDD